MDKLPIDMDLPTSRTDLSKMDNLRWLVRNMGVRNSDHPQFHSELRRILTLIKQTEKHNV